MKRYNLYTKFLKKNYSSRKLTLYIEHMKADDIILVRPYMPVYTSGKVFIKNYWGSWQIITDKYQPYTATFNLSKEELETIGYYRIGMYVDGATTNNKLYMNHIQLAEGTVKKYHQPEESIPKSTVKLQNNFYANLYSSNTGDYLQVIRPYYNNFDTETLTKSKVTVLAPHLANEDDIDSPQNIGLEFMNSSDQIIEILR